MIQLASTKLVATVLMLVPSASSKVLHTARHAAALEETFDITPEEARSAKGSAYNLLLSQF